jgi:dTDP-4-dehydrorhamnose reductase
VRILITGAKGQLGAALTKTLVRDELYLVDLPQLDLTSFYATLNFFRLVRPELVIHCAAKTNVDECELKPDDAYLNNVVATRNVVNACQMAQADLVYISTDYVFDGQRNTPYHEYDGCNPLNIYGKTKLIGEEIVKTHLTRFYIIRTAWLFGDVGGNFVKTMIKQIQTAGSVQVVDDQKGSPTYASDLAKAIEQLIRTGAYGIYHITNDGICSWYEFAQLIADAINKKNDHIEPITTAKLNRPALRPQYSILAKDLLSDLGISMPSYQDALQRFIKENSTVH